MGIERVVVYYTVNISLAVCAKGNVQSSIDPVVGENIKRRLDAWHSQ